MLGSKWFKLNKDRTLYLLLICFSFVIPLIGGISPNQTAIYVAQFELFFVLVFLLFNQNITALNLLTKNKILFYLTCTWLLFFILSYIQLFFQDVLASQLYMAKLRFMFTLMHLTFLCCAISYFINTNYTKGYVFNVLPFSIVIIVIVFFMVLTSGVIIPSHYFKFNPPLSENIRYIGYLCTAGSLISCFWVLSKSVKHWSIVLFVSIALINLSFLVWLGGRTAIGAVVITLIFTILFLYMKRRLELHNLLLLIFIIIISIFIADQASVYSWNGISRLFIKTDINSFDLNSFSSNRLEIWKISMNAIFESPWIGLGPNGYFYIPERFFGVHPHNILIQFWLEWGVIGGTIFFGLVLYGALSGLKYILNSSSSKNECCISALSVISGLTLHSLTDGTYYHAQSLYFLVLAFAVVVSTQLKSKSSTPYKEIN